MGHSAKPSNFLGAFLLVSVVAFSVAETEGDALALSNLTHTGDHDDGGDYDNKFSKSNDDDSSDYGYGKELTPSDSDLYPERPDDDVTLFEDFLDPGCELLVSNSAKISRIDKIFHPVFMFFSGASATISTESSMSLAVNLTAVPRYHMMPARIDLQSKILELHPSPLVAINLLNLTDNLIPSFSMLLIKKGTRTLGNCTNGLPFYKLTKKSTAGLSPREHEEFLIFSTQESGSFNFACRVRYRKKTIFGSHWASYEVSLCYSGGIIVPKIMTESSICHPIPPSALHRLTISGDPKANEAKVNGVLLPGQVGNSFITLKSFTANVTIVDCSLNTCPRLYKLRTPPGNTTEVPDKTCVVDSRDTAVLVALLSVIFFTLMVIDAVIFVVNYIRRRFFNISLEQDLENLQWHLNTRPIPHIWQIPPPLPERSPPSLTGSILRRRLVREDDDEEEEDSDHGLVLALAQIKEDEYDVE